MRKLLAVLALAVFTAGAGAPAAVPAAVGAAPATLPQAASCGGVWVVVDFGSLGGGVQSKCATSHGTGLAALRSAGFSPTVDEGFVYKISGKPGKADINKAYWSYWHAKADGNGGYSAWAYSNLGAGSYQPKQGDAEGWRFVLLSDPRTPPQASPPSNANESPKPKPTKTSTKPTPKPTKTSSPGRTSAKPTATRAPTTATGAAKPTSATAKNTSTKKAGASASAKNSPSGSGSASATTSEATASATADTGQTEVAQEQPGASDGSAPTGSPVGAIVTGAVVVAAAGGLGGWWLLKERKP